MAIDQSVFSSSFVSLAITDYTGSPISVSVTGLVGDIIIPRTRGVQHTSIQVNTQSGKVLSATPVHGVTSQPTFSFTALMVDINDASEAALWVSLVKALDLDSVAGTAHSGSVYTSQLTNSGKLQAKFVFTEINELAVSHVTTWPAIVTSVVDTVVDGVKALTVNCEIVGAPTLA